MIKENKELLGYNTDIYGFVSAIPAGLQKNLNSKKAAVLGAGGAARAVAIGLASLEMEEITFYARNPQKSLDLKNSMQANFSNIKINVLEHNYYDDLSYASIIINTTPLGMEGTNEDISPLAQAAMEKLPNDTIIYDLVYKPRQTRFIQHAKNQGLTVIEGLEMLVLQGAKAFEIWTGEKAPVDIMRNAITKIF